MIRSSHYFWGGVLVILGGLLMLETLGLVQINFWNLFLPLILILLGAWVLIGYFIPGKPLEMEPGRVAVEGAASAKILLQHGGGKLTLKSGAEPFDLLTGSFSGGIDIDSKQEGDQLTVNIRPKYRRLAVMGPPWIWGPNNRFDWDMRLSDEIPLDLVIKTGANESSLDLTDLQVKYLRVETGASSTNIKLSETVPYSKTIIKAGAASVKIQIPANVSAKIHVSGGLTDARVDRNRFPKVGGYYQSQDYESSLQKADIRVDMGVGSVVVG